MKLTIFFLVFIFGSVLAGFFGASPVRGTNQSVFTISVWVKPTGSAASKAILGKAEELRVATNASSQPVCQIKSGASWQTAATSSAAISVGAWSHVACTYDLAYVRIYVNGVEKGSQALAVAADDTAAVVKIGRDDSASTPYGYFAGQVDEFKFYTSALTVDQIAIDFNGGKVLQLGGQTSATGATGQAAEYCVPGDTTSCAGPVGEWKFDEKTGGTANDTSGNGNTGTWSGTGTQHWARGIHGSAGQFDGTSDRVMMSSSSNFALNDQSATAEFWINTATGFTDFAQSVGLSSSGSSWKVYNMQSNKLYIKMWNDAGTGYDFQTNYVTVTDNQWIHAAYVMSKSGGNMTVSTYQNGRLVGSQTQAVAGTFTSAGAPYVWTTNFGKPGKVDDFKIFNYARTPAQIAWDYNRGKPVGWWKMDEGEGGSAYDSSGNANTGTLTTMDPPNDWVTGKFGQALDFDGGNDSVEISNASIIGTSTNFSIGAWVKTTDGLGAVYGEFIASGDHTRNYLVINGGKVVFDQYSPSGGSLLSNASVNDGTWHHIFYTQNGTSRTIYVDGKLDNFDSSAETYSGDTPTATRIGYRGSNQLPSSFTGQIDDVRVYNYALTAEQVKQVMNEGSAVRFGE